MIHCLIGHSSSGKSTVERLLGERYGIPKIVSYTTRPKRKNEKDGVDYHFIDYQTFKQLDSEGLFVETIQYRDWNYGLSLSGIDYLNNDYIVVVTTHGYDKLVKVVSKEMVNAIHIKVEERERIIRQLKRGDDVDEVIRRIGTDRIDFAGVEEISDYVVENHDIDETVQTVYNIITKTK